MTRIYFVRHAQPEHGHADDRTRPLTDEGKMECYQPFYGIRIDKRTAKKCRCPETEI